jgi:hypothetical protein
MHRSDAGRVGPDYLRFFIIMGGAPRRSTPPSPV